MFFVKLNSFQLQVLDILKQVQNEKQCIKYGILKTEYFKVFEILKQVQNETIHKPLNTSN